mgnify:CR=1 FL=1
MSCVRVTELIQSPFWILLRDYGQNSFAPVSLETFGAFVETTLRYIINWLLALL